MPKVIPDKDAVARGARDESGQKFQPPKRPVEERILEALNGIRDAVSAPPEVADDAAALKSLTMEMVKQTALLSALCAEKNGHVVNESPYIFDIKRDGNGYIQQVVVTPEKPVTH